MTIRNTVSALLIGSLFSATGTWAQTAEPDAADCDFYDAESIVKAQQQARQDSLDLLHFKPAAPVATDACRVPSGDDPGISFRVLQNRIYGFFHGVRNANTYVVVLAPEGTPLMSPVDGIRYKTGDLIGKARVIGDNEATSFAALHLEPSTRYEIAVYAGNTNCTQGIVYNTLPLYTGMKTTAATAEYNYYYGNLHSHSGYSDGNKENTSLTPAADYAFAKDAQCMDFLGIAEHNHYSSPANPGMLRSRYNPGIQQANTFTGSNPGFLALYGMEFGVISNGGHVVVYGIDSLLGWETLNGSPNYDIFVGKFDYSGTNGLFSTVQRFRASNAFAYLAHPDDNDYGNLLNTAYRPIADSALIGSAVENGPAYSEATNYSDYPSRLSYLQYYKGLLANGYHVGPIIDHDNHYLTFGHTAKSRLVVLSPSIGKADFLSAMRSRSFYTSHSCTAALDFIVSGASMGKEIQNTGAPAIVVSIEDPAYSQAPSIRIYKGINDGTQAVLVASGSGNTFSYTDNDLADGASAYYFADISIGGARTLSSPVWYHRNDNPSTAVRPTPEPARSNDLLVMENPVKSGTLRFMLTTPVHKATIITLADMYGRVLYQTGLAANETAGSIDIGSLPAGTYLLRAAGEGINAIARFEKY